MIELRNICKSYEGKHGTAHILKGINLTVNRGEKFGILGRNGAGKSTLFRVMGRIEQPTSGEIIQTMSLSWPLAFAGGFQGALTGYDNLRFVSRIYGVKFEDRVDFVREFTELGRYLAEPVRIYSSGMRARLAFALSMAVEFDCYLIDEVTAVGDARFQEKCQTELFERRSDRALIMISHMPEYLRLHCERGGVVVDGRLHEFDSIDDAIAFHHERMAD
jgi:capsular polysaccharide transport system ATP-binding protein